MSLLFAISFVLLARPQVKLAMAERSDPDLLPQGA